ADSGAVLPPHSSGGFSNLRAQHPCPATAARPRGDRRIPALPDRGHARRRDARAGRGSTPVAGRVRAPVRAAFRLAAGFAEIRRDRRRPTATNGPPGGGPPV